MKWMFVSNYLQMIAFEDDKTGLLSVGVDIFDRLYLKERKISLPMVIMSTIKRKYDK